MSEHLMDLYNQDFVPPVEDGKAVLYAAYDNSDPDDPLGFLFDQEDNWAYVFVPPSGSVSDDRDNDFRFLIRNALNAVSKSRWHMRVESWDYYGNDGVKVVCVPSN